MALVDPARADEGHEAQETASRRKAQRGIADERPGKPGEEPVDADEREDVTAREARPAERRDDDPDVGPGHRSWPVHERLEPGRDEGGAPGHGLEQRLGPEPDEGQRPDDD